MIVFMSLFFLRYDDMYSLYVTFKDGQTGETRTANLTKSVALFFDDNGYVCEESFEPDVMKLHESLTSEKKEK